MSAPRIERLVADGRPNVRLDEVQRAALAALKRKIQNGDYRVEPARCICGAGIDEGVLLAKKDRYGLSIDTYLCRRCSVLWSSPQFDDASLGNFYASDYRALYSGASLPTERFFADQIARGTATLDFLRRHLPVRPGLRVYDIGCGAGGLLIPFARQGFAVSGCDLSGEYLARGRQEGLDLEQGPPSVLRSRGSADLVLASHVLEHLREPRRELLAWRDLLVPGGLLYIELPGVLTAYERYGDLGRFLQNAHLWHFTLDTLTALCAGSGFALVRGDENIRALFVAGDVAGTPIRSAPEADDLLAYVDGRERRLLLSRTIRMARVAPARVLARAFGDRGLRIAERLRLPLA